MCVSVSVELLVRKRKADIVCIEVVSILLVWGSKAPKVELSY